VRHARQEALDELEPVLAELRCFEQLTEKSRGVFYRRSKSFLHFHEDPEGLFADVQLGPDDELARLRVTDPAERAALVEAVHAVLADGI
jgi:hypothetical protein